MYSGLISACDCLASRAHRERHRLFLLIHLSCPASGLQYDRHFFAYRLQGCHPRMPSNRWTRLLLPIGRPSKAWLQGKVSTANWQPSAWSWNASGCCLSGSLSGSVSRERVSNTPVSKLQFISCPCSSLLCPQLPLLSAFADMFVHGSDTRSRPHVLLCPDGWLSSAIRQM